MAEDTARRRSRSPWRRWGRGGPGRDTASARPRSRFSGGEGSDERQHDLPDPYRCGQVAARPCRGARPVGRVGLARHLSLPRHAERQGGELVADYFSTQVTCVMTYASSARQLTARTKTANGNGLRHDCGCGRPPRRSGLHRGPAVRPPDTVVAMALAYHAFMAGRQLGDDGVTI